MWSHCRLVQHGRTQGYGELSQQNHHSAQKGKKSVEFAELWENKIPMLTNACN